MWVGEEMSFGMGVECLRLPRIPKKRNILYLNPPSGLEGMWFDSKLEDDRDNPKWGGQ